MSGKKHFVNKKIRKKGRRRQGETKEKKGDRTLLSVRKHFVISALSLLSLALLPYVCVVANFCSCHLLIFVFFLFVVCNQNGHFLIVKLLLECGADKNIMWKGTMTPTQIALQKGHHNIVQLLSTFN